ncbi:MAG: tetratricopeptide repeat protein [Planctomycetes bacterium]|nr:tetratricopeptide repeat protein [Planctomycetota bacterium]
MDRLPRARIAGLIIAVTVAGGVVFWVSSWLGHQRPLDQADRSQASTAINLPSKDSSAARAALKAKFVGSDSCVECHAEIAARFHASGMGQSLWKVGSAPPLEDYNHNVSFSPDGHHHYSVVKTMEGVFHHERLTDDKGQTIYDQAYKVEFVVGSGLQGRSYLFNRGGMLFMSPIGWYSRSGKWDLSPGYKLPSHRRFDRRVPSACLECHAGQMNLTDRPDVFEDPPFREIAIGCERCHGPGADHIQFRRQQTGSFESDPIVNPSKLEPAQREDVCSQCHLSGEGRYLRDGCHFGEFQPGTRLEETYLIFVRGNRTTDDGKTRAVSQVEQMRSSTCYLNSGGSLGCTSCHDPHSQPPANTQTSFYRERCLKCHAERGCAVTESDRRARQPDDSCIACHMPRLNASDVPHTTQSDHRILRAPVTPIPAGDQTFEMPALYDGAEQRLPGIVVDRAKGIWLAEQAERLTNPQLATQASRILEGVLRERPNDVEVLNALGTAAAVNGRFQESMTYWNAVLAIDPNRELTLSTTATLLLNQGKADAGRAMLERYLKVQPNYGGAWGRYSGLLSRANETDKAIEAARKSIELDPSNPKTYHHLAQLYGRIGNKEQEQIYRDLGNRIQLNRFSR